MVQFTYLVPYCTTLVRGLRFCYMVCVSFGIHINGMIQGFQVLSNSCLGIQVLFKYFAWQDAWLMRLPPNAAPSEGPEWAGSLFSWNGPRFSSLSAKNSPWKLGWFPCSPNQGPEQRLEELEHCDMWCVEHLAASPPKGVSKAPLSHLFRYCLSFLKTFHVSSKRLHQFNGLIGSAGF